jgi:predicted TIM-barrel fold metal-dependent hydrolase
MSGLLSDEEIEQLMPSELVPTRMPIPTQIVASDEYYPDPQNEKQREVEHRLNALADRHGARTGMSRRSFFQSAAGMAAAFLAMNTVYGRLFDASEAEAATPGLAEERASSLRGQFIMDMHTHFLRDDTRLDKFVKMREQVGVSGWNPELVGREQSLEDLKYENYMKEIFLDSDTKIALISSAPSEIEHDWFLTNAMMAEARDKVNAQAGSKRLYAHAIFTPGRPGWLEALDAALELKPDSVKGYTIGDNTHKELSVHPWRMDDENVAYLGYERMRKAGIRNICVHKGLFPPSVAAKFPHLAPYADVSDVARAAKDWPDMNFIIYHAGYRHVGGDPEMALDEFERSGRIEWTTDLADIPEKHGVTNVYADVGQLFAVTLVAQPRMCAALMGTLVRGLGADHVCWGTDAVWTGSPQWQIEGLRRLEIPEDMQKAHGFAPLGVADGPVKSAIFGDNNARLYGLSRERRGDWRDDALSARRAAYERDGGGRSNIRYGYVFPTGDMRHEVFA